MGKALIQFVGYYTEYDFLLDFEERVKVLGQKVFACATSFLRDMIVIPLDNVHAILCISMWNL